MTNIVNYNQEYINTILSYFAYVNMDGKDGWSNLINKDLSENNDFTNNYRKYLLNKHGEPKATIEFNNSQNALNMVIENFVITKQIVTTGGNGFSATTFKLKNDLPLHGYYAGETFVAFRGTEASQWGDIVTDIFLATSDASASGPTRRAFERIFKSVRSQETQAVAYLTTEIYDSVLKLNITGHSLGGYLAVRSLLTFQKNIYERFEENTKNKKENTDLIFTDAENTKALREAKVLAYIQGEIKGISTFNGAGLSMLDGFFIGDQPLENLVKNFYSIRGLNVTAGNFYEMIMGKGQNISIFEHLGPRYGTSTENDSMMENHSMSLLVNSIGMMSTLETLIKEYPNSVKDIDGNLVTGQDARLYSINKLIMTATYEDRDEGKALYKLGQRIIEGFGIKDNLVYNQNPDGSTTTKINYLASFIGLKEFFVNNPTFKINVTDNFDNITLVDSNSNRSAMYSLLNDLSYTLDVPSGYSDGIFDRSQKGAELYDVSLYSQEYIDQLKIYNKHLLNVIENKLYETLPYYFTIGDPDVDAKYAFVIKTNKYGIAENEIFYINANEADIEDNLVQYTYFKKANEDLFVNKNNSIVYDTSLADTIVVSSSGNTIYSFNGSDYITINNGTVNNTIVLTENTDNIQIVNRNTAITDESGLTINFKQINDDLKVKVNTITNDFINNKVTIKNGIQETTVSGSFNIETSNKTYTYQDIVALTLTFPEMFMDGFVDLDIVVNEIFINEYISKTKEKFNNSKIPSEKISNAHAEYIIAQLGQYTILTTDNKNTTTLVNYVNNKIHTVEMSHTFETTVQFKLAEINSAVDNIDIRNQINEITKSYSGNEYLSLEDANELDPFNSSEINGVYLQKNTKLYLSETLSDGRIIWKWDGNYYYDRVDESGNTIEAFYDNTSTGVGFKKYMKENIVIKPTDNKTSNFYGTDGSDIIIGDTIYGQSNYYLDENGNVIESDVDTRQNGNDILIGGTITAYSGDNLILQTQMGTVNGGAGNDTIISDALFSTVYTDKTNKETKLNQNTVILLKQGTVYSSKGQNTITVSHPISYVYATENDTVYMNAGYYYSYNIEKQGQNDYYFEQRHDFYSNYNGLLGNNKVYINGQVEAYLYTGDEVFVNGGSGLIKGFGDNKYNLMNNFEVYSGGNSEYVINGEYNTIHFGQNDTYEIKMSNYNKYYTNNEQNGTYNIIGKSNTIFVGSAEYTLDLNGTNTTVNYMNDNENTQILNINEVNKTDINLNEKTIDELYINNYSDIYLNDGSIDSLNIKSINGKTTLEDLNVEDLSIESNIMTSLLFERYNNNIKNIIASNVSIEGDINNIQNLRLDGNISSKLDFNNKSGAVDIDGYINLLSVNNANLTYFKYNKSAKEKGLSTINILDSQIDTLSEITNFSNTHLDLIRTNANKIDLSKLQDSSLTSNGLINSIEIDSLNNSTVSFANLDIVLDSIVIKEFDTSSTFAITGSGSANTSVRLGNMISTINNSEQVQINLNNGLMSVYATRFDKGDFNLNGDTVYLSLSGDNINQPNIIINDGDLHGQLSYINKANLSNVKLYKIRFSGVTSLTLDNVEINNGSDVIFDRVEELIIKQDDSLIVTKDKLGDIITDYKFQYVMDYKIIIGNKTYTKNEIENIRNQLGGSLTAYAVLNEADIEYVGLPIEQPESETPYTDDNGILQGSYHNDVFNITNTTKENVIEGNSGDDTYNFQGYHYKPNTIRYEEGDGLDTITSNQYVVLKINLSEMEKSKLSFSYEKNMYNINDVLNIFYKGIQIFRVNNLSKMNLTLQTIEGIMTSSDIDKFSKTITGTDQNDIINGTIESNYIYAGKGDDIINLQGYGNNEIYYNLGDGHDTINAPSTSYTVMFENTISQSNVTYISTGANSFDVLLNNEVILSINEASSAYLKFMSNYATVNGTTILEDLNSIVGTDDADVINVDTASTVKAKGGNDIINVNNNNAKIYAGTGNDVININYASGGSTYSTVYYENGDGFTKINLAETDFNKVNLQLNVSGTLTYAYDVNNHNTLNIYLSTMFGMPSEKIVAIENYRKVIWDTITDGRTNVYRNGTPISHTTIDNQAETNYKNELNNMVATSNVSQNINSLIEIMASYDDVDDVDVNTPSASSIIRNDDK